MYNMSFWSRFHRKFHWSLDKIGICFDYKGDEVFWVFPWKRAVKHMKWLSISFECNFESLKELDKNWKNYFEAMKQ